MSAAPSAGSSAHSSVMPSCCGVNTTRRWVIASWWRCSARRGSAAITARRSEVPNWARVCSGARRSTRCSIFVVVSASNGPIASASFMACRYGSCPPRSSSSAAGSRSRSVRAIESRRSAVPGESRSAGADLLAGVIDQLPARPIHSPSVQRREDLLLRGLQQRDGPLEADQQIHPPRVGQRLGLEHEQRRHVIPTRHARSQFGGDRVRRFEHVHLGDGRRMLEHVYESINSQQCRLPLFHKEIRADSVASR